MQTRRNLLVSTYGGDVSQIMPGLRALPHDHLLLVTERTLEKSEAIQVLLDRLGIRYEVLVVNPADLTGAAMKIEDSMHKHKAQGWATRMDITGGRKLLSDAALLAALSTGSEVCCFESGQRRFPLLVARRVKEALPKQIADPLLDISWPIPLSELKGRSDNVPLPSLLRTMKRMDLVRSEESDMGPMLTLTERGTACREWLLRAKAVSVSWE